MPPIKLKLDKKELVLKTVNKLAHYDTAVMRCSGLLDRIKYLKIELNHIEQELATIIKDSLK